MGFLYSTGAEIGYQIAKNAKIHFLLWKKWKNIESAQLCNSNYIHIATYIQLLVFNHTYIHTCIPTYILRYAHTYIITSYILTYMHKYMHSYIHTKDIKRNLET